MGFTQATFDYLKGLSENNSKEWFDANRDRYETHWKAAALDFIADISSRMAALSPPLQAQPKLNGSLRRINRDVRFSKDKSPYNARLHMIFWAGQKPIGGPGMHIVLSPTGVGYGAGQFGIEPGRLAELRKRIIGPDGDELIGALKTAEKAGCRMDDPDLKRLPKGIEATGKREELVRYKSFVTRTHENEAEPSVMIGSGASDWVMEVTGSVLPLIRWLAKP